MSKAKEGIKEKLKNGYKYFYVYAVRKEDGTVRRICYDFFYSLKSVDLGKEHDKLELIVSSACANRKKKDTDVIELLSVALISNEAEKKNIYRYMVFNGLIESRRNVRLTGINYVLTSTFPFSEDTLKQLGTDNTETKSIVLLAVKPLAGGKDNSMEVVNTSSFYSSFDSEMINNSTVAA